MILLFFFIANTRPTAKAQLYTSYEAMRLYTQAAVVLVPCDHGEGTFQYSTSVSNINGNDDDGDVDNVV